MFKYNIFLIIKPVKEKLKTEVSLDNTNCDQPPQERVRTTDESDEDIGRPQKYVRLIDRKLTRVNI